MVFKKKIKKTTMITTSKDKVERYFNLKTSRDNFMYTFFYTNIYDVSRNYEVIMDGDVYLKYI